MGMGITRIPDQSIRTYYSSHWLNKISPFLEGQMFARLQALIAIFLISASTPVSAQGLEAGSWQTMTPSGGIGPDQDSLLPPEVVPLDPSAASALSASQAQSRQAGAAGQANVPGLVQAQEANPMDLRKQAFDQLYGGQSTLPPNAVNQIWRAGQQAQQAMQPMQPIMGQPDLPGLAPTSSNTPQPQLGAPNYQMANNQQMHQGYIAQSQTLTGQAQNQPQPVNTRRGGFSNMLNYAAAAGMGVTSGLMMNNPWLGAGIFATTMTGFGVRNNSRF